MNPDVEKILTAFKTNRRLAYETLFAHRHTQETPEFHYAMRMNWESDCRNVIVQAFRGAGKSTTLEEHAIVTALFAEAKNILIVGENEDMAMDRLRSIKHELEFNDRITVAFGSQVGPTWQETKIVLANGVVIHCKGKGQSLRGTKHLSQRPDYCLVDDLEDRDSVSTPAARAKLSKWFFTELIPALDVEYRIRMAATPLDPEALAVFLSHDQSWLSAIYPIEHVNSSGARVATWPSRFPIEWVDTKRESMYRAGQGDGWMQEYMCRAVDPASRIFTSPMFRFDPIPRTWHAVYAVYDPARTATKKSDFTGVAIGSWMGNRLIVWEARAHRWMPDAIIRDMVDVDMKYSPVAIGVEATGLNEWVLQPLRNNPSVLPIRELHAPKGKQDFIRGLQPFFRAKEIIFAGKAEDFADAIEQLTSFPTGHDDIPNALAYLLKMRPGLPVYDGFGSTHLSDELSLLPRVPVYLAINTGDGVTTAALIQAQGGSIGVLADWAVEADPGQALQGMIQSAGAYANAKLTHYAPKDHFSLSSSGLKAAARHIPIELRSGGDLFNGREIIRSAMDRQVRGIPCLRIGPDASWTRRAFSGGYAITQGKMQAREGLYKVLMEGIEAFVATLGSGLANKATDGVVYATAPDGRRYISARA